jgi:dipeptidase
MCLAIVVGKNVSETGNVLFGHNEQNFNRHPINYRYISNGNNINRYKLNDKSFSYLYAEVPKLHYSDNCINEVGVAITGNGCPSTETDLEMSINMGNITKGIGQAFPQVIAKHASSAREGIKLVETIMKDFGYISSGRTYVIADKEEAFVVSVLLGRSWLAYKVPDDSAVVIPNTFVTANIHREDFDVEYFGSKDILEKIESDDSFDFVDKFSAKPEYENMRFETGIDSRQHYLQELITGQELSKKSPLKFAIKPKAKISVGELMSLLRSHHSSENIHQSEQEVDSGYYRSSCNIATQESAIFDFSKDVIYRAMSVPCHSIYIPLFNNVKLPEKLGIEINDHYNPNPKIYNDETLDFWQFYNFAHKLEQNKHLKPEFFNIRDKFELNQLNLVDNYVKKDNLSKYEFTKERIDKAKKILGAFEDRLI